LNQIGTSIIASVPTSPNPTSPPRSTFSKVGFRFIIELKAAGEICGEHVAQILGIFFCVFSVIFVAKHIQALPPQHYDQFIELQQSEGEFHVLPIKHH
jgi:hypothetical protein